MKKTIKFYFQQCKKALKSFKFAVAKFFIFIILSLINFYSFFISPLLGVRCRFYPTCSEYCSASLKEHGLIKGSAYSLRRIVRCHPIKILGGADGIDLVPKKNYKTKELN